MIARYDLAFADIKEGIMAWPVWGRLGWRETRLRYVRTTLGPFWTMLSLGIFVTVMGILWSQLWKIDPKVYMPFLTSGMITWLLLSIIIVEGCGIFTGSDLLKQLRVPLTMLGCATVWRNVMVFAHNFVIYLLIFIYSGKPVTWATLLVIPGLLLLCVNALWMTLVLGLVCARYRDIQQLVQSLLQISMFLTPIFWTPDQLQGRAVAFVDYNVLYHLIEIVRAPLMGIAPSAWTWTMALLTALLGWGLVFFLYARFRHRVVYWI